MNTRQESKSEQVSALQQRVAGLEAQAARLRRTQAIIGLVVVAVVTAAAVRPTPERIAAEQFTLLDANGNECAVWGAAPPKDTEFGSAYLTFRRSDKSDGIAVRLDAGTQDPSLLLKGMSWLQNGGPTDASVLLKVSPSGPRVDLQGTQQPPAAEPPGFVSLRTTIGLALSDGKPCCTATRGATEVWVAP